MQYRSLTITKFLLVSLFYPTIYIFLLIKIFLTGHQGQGTEKKIIFLCHAQSDPFYEFYWFGDFYILPKYFKNSKENLKLLFIYKCFHKSHVFVLRIRSYHYKIKCMKTEVD